MSRSLFAMNQRYAFLLSMKALPITEIKMVVPVVQSISIGCFFCLLRYTKKKMSHSFQIFPFFFQSIDYRLGVAQKVNGSILGACDLASK